MQAKTLADLYSDWDKVQAHAQAWQKRTLKDAFDADRNRAARYSVGAAGLELDFSKNHIDDETLQLLMGVADQANLKAAIKKLLRGDHVNNTEDRPALHSALRFQGKPQTAEHQEVKATLDKMAKLIKSVHSGEWKGYKGEKITDVVNIGIGGSDLGPRMITKALTPFHTGDVKVHFVANIDGAEIHDLTRGLNPSTTLFLVASKSFSTLETLENSLTARKWMLDNGCAQDQLAKHFVAISSKVEKAVEFGIAAENVYPIWDWVGGRYSLWSAIGMPIAFAIGMDNFNKLRAGAAAMDDHFAEAPLERNIPALMGLLMFWYSSCLGTDTQAILPYAYHLQLLPAYLQQLEMESNGKSVTKSGERVDYQTGSIVWGTEGTNGQHSFHQLLHQGTTMVPIDFIATLQAHHPLDHQHKFLFANCVAQSQALMTGRDQATSEAEMRAQGMSDEQIAELAPHKVHPGNRPSNTILMDKLTPETLGALIAAYEHKVYTLGVLWNINSFDQWGVELGKLLGTHVATAIDTTDIPSDWDSSTQTLVKKFTEANKNL
ncbi:glucose-6-phosphate isomerase [Saccharophagus degradans]|uniref:Glucose-6-phosphate isomerase n=2 Tax=Saccharophagus degradans TaxID=86304 RepID=G6PI_SACD2|nr:glucose-6-phosphate isomerase [Saccharophagus degradans]Q21M11.1 RecName: Full=Glucose-6-phosphate isomerase; Short=GPI; AltName: Full=Phosphoglucose isomerase; Short=PGI; AltName: Full=Phosphohexose isomerase; Short=PHI [Saccharophagus degradans 2-40]ABD80268.1 glucose-6-phosphate isomerase [Saccharophagus degradans 2-40]MDO6424032.1 glucose-6-phosphate isomerase [Saccharophagus degradans]MDO6609401.1 glucose-6-phosphate isomerase [Saccharophagus degradans]